MLHAVNPNAILETRSEETDPGPAVELGRRRVLPGGIDVEV
jgi:hypothetical protein